MQKHAYNHRLLPFIDPDDLDVCDQVDALLRDIPAADDYDADDDFDIRDVFDPEVPADPNRPFTPSSGFTDFSNNFVQPPVCNRFSLTPRPSTRYGGPKPVKYETKQHTPEDVRIEAAYEAMSIVYDAIADVHLSDEETLNEAVNMTGSQLTMQDIEANRLLASDSERRAEMTALAADVVLDSGMSAAGVQMCMVSRQCCCNTLVAQATFISPLFAPTHRNMMQISQQTQFDPVTMALH